jgi:hypothetical protein
MVATLVVMVILIGVMHFQYHCALDTYKADVHVTAARLGLLLLDGWKTTEGDVLTYNPEVDFDLLALDEFTVVADPGLPGVANSFKIYRVEVNSVKYFVKMSYADETGGPSIRRVLNVAIAWSRDWGSTTLDFEPRRLIRLTKYASYYTG